MYISRLVCLLYKHKRYESIIHILGTSLVLTPRQKLALRQELEVRRLGLEPWSDLSPWQRLSRSQQKKFNEKYLALPPELQVDDI